MWKVLGVTALACCAIMLICMTALTAVMTWMNISGMLRGN